MSIAGLIILSAFAALGIYYFVLVIMEIVFSSDMSNVVTIVPIVSKEVPVGDVLRTVNNLSSGNITILVDLDGGIDAAPYIEQGLCMAATTPEKLGGILCGIIEK